MSSVEAEGNSIDEAIDLALRRLGVSRDRAEIEILSNATRGLFGLGGRKARVRASLRTAVSGEPEPARRVPEAPRVPASPPAPTTPSARAPAPAAPARPARPSTTGTSEPRPAPVPRPEAPPSPPDPRTLARAREVLQEVITLIGSEAKVEISDGTEGPALAITGDETGVLIGRRGQTLDALEYMVNRIVSRDDEHASRIGIDSQNYRARRREALTALAHRLAEQARRRRKPVTLNPMSPRDRRIVHLALQDAPSLTTRSLGSGYFRKLVIIPGGRDKGPRGR